MRNALRSVAAERDYWCGIPMPIAGEHLVVEKTYPNAAKLMAIGLRETGADAEHAAAKIRNSFWSWRWRCDVLVWEEDGRIQWGKAGHPHHITMDMRSLGCCDAWGIEQEAKAVHTLAGLLPHRQFKQYMLTGMFMERSARSGVSYLFRRLKPTVAISTRTEQVRVLAALCLHPIAYYAGSWAGAMTPTDDVIAHLMMMRGDERMFWRRANQHAPFRPEAGL